MKKLSILLFILSSITFSAQVHKVGVGIGTTNFQKPCIEGHYQFNYKLIYSQVGYMYNPGYDKEFYKELHFISAIVGIQSNDSKRLSVLGGFGIAYMTAKNHEVVGSNDFLENQFCPVFFTGLQGRLAPKHFIAVKFYLDEFRYSFYHNYKRYESAIDGRLNVCYLFKFGKS